MAHLPRCMQLRRIEAVLFQATQLTRQMINNHRPINRLPPEILAQIFTWIHEESRRPRSYSHYPEQHTNLGNPPLQESLTFSAVCKRWRDVAICTPPIWSYVHNRHLYYLPVAQQRWSQGGPLRACINAPVGPVIAEQLRIGGPRLYILETTGLSMSTLAPLLSFNANELRMCKINQSSSHPINLRVENALTTLFNNCAPKLRTLYIENLHSLPAMQFPTLTHLAIDATWWRPETRMFPPFTCRQFVEFLSGSPHLQTLHLRHLVMIVESDTVVATHVKIQLPSLRMLSVKSWSQQTFDHEPTLESAFRDVILSILELPSSCLVHIGIIPPSEFAGVLSRLPVDDAPTCMRMSKPRDTSVIRADDVHRHCATLQAVTPRQHRAVRIDIQLSHTPGTNRALERMHICDAIHDSLFFSRVRTLWLEDDLGDLWVESQDIPPTLKNVETLITVTGCPGKGSWEALARLLVCPDDAVAVEVFPSLTTLAIKVLDYDDSADQAADVAAICLSRAELGHPIRRLVVVTTHPDGSLDEHFANINGVVDEFVVVGPYLTHEVMWEAQLPRECCREDERHVLWPSWIRNPF